MKLKTGFILLMIVMASAFHNTLKAQLDANIDDKYNHELKQISHKDKKKIGDDLFNSGSFYNAIEYYKDYLVDDNSDADVTFKLAESYRYSRDYKRAEEWYKKAYDMDKSGNGAAQFYQAMMMRYNCKQEQAKPLLSDFLDNYRGSNSKELKRQARIELDGCEMALDQMAHPIPNLEIKHLGSAVNNPYSDFGPAADGNDAMVYTSVKSDTVVIIGENNRTNYVSRIYRSTRKGNHWTKGTQFGNDNINSDVDHTGNGSFSPNGKTFFFTRCHEISPVDLHIQCDIYMSKKENGEWQKPIKLNSKVNAPKSTNTQPTVGRTGGGTFLYFVSDRDGGVGGLDIWRSKISSDGECAEAENLGKQINTKADDCTPFYDNVENVLYFSSNGRIGLGGFDIYKAAADGKKFMDAENVGYPINSCVDDRYYTLTPNHRGGFFVSNRPEDFYFKSSDGASIKSPTCCDDIFEFKINIIPHFALKGYVFDVNDKEKATPLTDVIVYLQNNANSPKTLKMDTCSFKQKKYFFDTEKDAVYKLKASKNGYYDGYAAASFEGLTESDTLRVDIFLRPITVETVRLEGIFYDFDKATLRPESDSALMALTKFMNDQPNIRVEIGSHTDSKGSDEYNDRLSQARAQSVVDYLIVHGIEASRLEAKGYGERNPEVPNENPDGSDCPVCRQRNRRTEFKILGQVKGVNIVYNQGMPSVIDSTSSTHEKLEQESMGLGRQELTSNGNVVDATQAAKTEKHSAGTLFNSNNYEKVQEKPVDVEDEQPEVQIREINANRKKAPQPNFNAPENVAPQQSAPKSSSTIQNNNSVNTNVKNDDNEDAEPTPASATSKMSAKQQKEAEKKAKEEKIKAEKKAKEDTEKVKKSSANGSDKNLEKAKKEAEKKAKEDAAKAEKQAKEAAKKAEKEAAEAKKKADKEAKKNKPAAADKKKDDEE